MSESIMICKFCKSDKVYYWDNMEMCTTFDWGYCCDNCGRSLDPYDDVEFIIENKL